MLRVVTTMSALKVWLTLKGSNLVQRSMPLPSDSNSANDDARQGPLLVERRKETQDLSNQRLISEKGCPFLAKSYHSHLLLAVAANRRSLHVPPAKQPV